MRVTTFWPETASQLPVKTAVNVTVSFGWMEPTSVYTSVGVYSAGMALVMTTLLARLSSFSATTVKVTTSHWFTSAGPVTLTPLLGMVLWAAEALKGPLAVNQSGRKPGSPRTSPVPSSCSIQPGITVSEVRTPSAEATDASSFVDASTSSPSYHAGSTAADRGSGSGAGAAATDRGAMPAPIRLTSSAAIVIHPKTRVLIVYLQAL